jgi:hypothetical protein
VVSRLVQRESSASVAPRVDGYPRAEEDVREADHAVDEIHSAVGVVLVGDEGDVGAYGEGEVASGNGSPRGTRQACPQGSKATRPPKGLIRAHVKPGFAGDVDGEIPRVARVVRRRSPPGSRPNETAIEFVLMAHG